MLKPSPKTPLENEQIFWESAGAHAKELLEWCEGSLLRRSRWESGCAPQSVVRIEAPSGSAVMNSGLCRKSCFRKFSELLF